MRFIPKARRRWRLRKPVPTWARLLEDEEELVALIGPGKDDPPPQN